MHTFQITIFIKSARYFVQKTKTVVIYKTTHQSGLRKHPKDTILVQMKGENKRKKERKASKCFPSLSFESVDHNCYKDQLPLYTRKESQTKEDTKKKADYHKQHIPKLLITKNYSTTTFYNWTTQQPQRKLKF